MTKTITHYPTRQEQRLAMRYDEWLAWEGEGQHSEWVDGEVIVFMPPTIRHAQLIRFLAHVLGIYIEPRRLGELLVTPVEMRLERSAREPDILFVAEAHRDRLQPQRLLGPADLVVEIMSDDSTRRDRVDKFREYQDAGIPEYWLLDPRPGRQRSDVYHLVDGIYRAAPLDADGRYHSAVLPGFWLRPDWLWQEPLPNSLACLNEIAPDVLSSFHGDRPRSRPISSQ